MAVSCLITAWRTHEAELLNFMRHRLNNPSEAEDLLHDLFLKAWAQGDNFCSVVNARAGLFEVARNTLIDRSRRTRNEVTLPEDIPAIEPEFFAIDGLANCLPRVLSELSEEDREAIQRCDLEGMPQALFAELKGLSLPGAKSRIQRARQRLRAQMSKACQVRLDEAGHVCCFVPRPPLG